MVKASTDALTTAAQLETQSSGLIGQAQTYEQYAQLVAQAQNTQNAETSRTVGILQAVSPAFGSLISSYILSQSTIQALTPAQFEYANALVKTGMSAELAATQARQLITQQSTFKEFVAGLNVVLTEQAAKYDELTLAQLRFQFSGEQLATTFGNIQAAGPQYAQALNEINKLLEQGKLEPLEYANALQTIVNAANNAKSAEDALKDSMVELSAAAQELIVQEIQEAKSKQGNAIATKELHGFQTDLANIADAVAKGLFTDAEAADFLRLKYGEAAKEAEYLIAQQARIMEGEARIRKQKSATRDDSAGVGFNAPGRRGTGDVDAAIRGIEEAKKAAEEAAEAQRDLELARARASGNKAREIELLKAEQRQYAVGSAEYIKAQQAIEAAQREGGSKRAGAAQKTADKLEEISIKEGEKLTDAEIKKQQKLLDIQADFAEKYAAQVRENEVSKRTSRADFYEGLLDAPAGVDTSAMSAMYEQAFAEAQKIAQSGRAKLADEYLKLRTEQIEQLAELDKKRKEIEEDEDLSSKEKEAKLKQLEEVRKLREEAQKEELKNLVEGGDELENELNDRLTEEEARYDQNVDKIQTAADRAAEARIRAWQRANGVISGTVPAELANLTPEIPRIPATPAQPTQEPTTTNPVPITSPIPIQVTADKAMPVFDVTVFNQLNAVAARLEVGMTNIVNAINNSTNVLASKLDTVDGSVRRIQSKSVLAG